MNFFLCSGLNPQSQLYDTPKLNIVLNGSVILSIVLHLTVRLKILIFKMKTLPEQTSVESNLTLKFLKNFENQSLSGFAKNILFLFIFGTGVILVSIVNNFKPANLNIYPNYYFVYLLHLYGPVAFGICVSLSYYFRHKPLQKFIKMEVKEFIERYFFP